VQLRNYQTEKMIRPLREALRRSSSVVCVGPTGSGKTSCIAYIVKGALSRGKRVLIIVHKEEILGQILSTLNTWGVNAGQIASGKHMTSEHCQVAMIGTLINRLDIIPYVFDLVIIDECHHILEDNMWGKALKHPKIKSAVRIGDTATPQGRTNGAGLHPFFKEIVQDVSTADLIRDGWLVFPRLYKPEKEITDKFKITRGDYDRNQQEEVFSKKQIVGDAIEHYCQYLDGLPEIVSCVSLKHAHDMQKQYADYAKNTGKEWIGTMIQGGSKYKKQRKDALEGLATGSVQQVFFVDVLGEGVDVPVCAGLQWLRKTTSLVLYLQFIGRILRPVWPEYFDQYNSTAEERLHAISRSGKPFGVILDHAGNFYTHGHPVVDRKWGLEDTPTGRRIEQAAPVITQCPRCNSVWPGSPRKCPACGCIIDEQKNNSRKNPEVIKGILSEVIDLEESDLDKLAKFTMGLDVMGENERRKKMMGALRYIEKDKMKAVCNAVGYKKNWVDVMYRRMNIKRQGGTKKTQD